MKHLFAEKKGFTLVEVLITLLIISATIVAITRAFNVGFYVASDVESKDRALLIASGKMEELKATAEGGGVGALSDSGPDADPDFPLFSVEVDVTVGQDPAPVRVTVTWTIRGQQDSVYLDALISDF